MILAAPNPILLRNIIDFRIMSKAWAEKNKTTNVQDYKAKEENFASRNVNGTGPYKIISWQPESRIAMAVNEGWWDKPAGNVTQVLYTPIKSDSTRVSALLSGDVDMVTDLPTQDIDKLRGDKKLKVVDGPEVRTIFIAPRPGSNELKYSNVKGKNPFKDKRVREALNLAVDREAIKRSIMRGLSVPADIMVAPWRQRLQRRPRQAAQARSRQGQEAARRGRLPARLRVPAQLPQQPLRQRREDLRRAGVDVGQDRHHGEAERRRHGHLHPEGAELRHLGLHARLGRGHLRRAVFAAVAGAHAHVRCRRQLQLLQRSATPRSTN